MKDAIIMNVESVRTRASTSEALVTFAIPLEQAANVSQFMGMIGEQVGVAFAKVDQYTTQKSHRGKKSTTSGTYGQEARALRLSNFFRTPSVWRAIGKDEHFLDWLRGQPCAYCGDSDYVDGEQVCEAAHVRRVANGAGTSIKPDYSAVPLCHKHHAMQHEKGEWVLGDEDWWSKKRIHYVTEWGWEKLKDQLGYDSWKDIPPEVLKDWAMKASLEDYLPQEYR